jgi:hypothetical protein
VIAKAIEQANATKATVQVVTADAQVSVLHMSASGDHDPIHGVR